MSVTGLTAIIVLVAATLLGVVLYGLHRGRLSRGGALAAAILILAAASVILVYPSVLTTTHMS
ncbi:MULTISPECIES: hypothetical protein [unclassified Sphingobium]|uniref:hypothetical protein n=1 Tax=unclassified Sphingobium TaxID=2611147 RepID=UPI0009715533|nr:MULTISPECIES: hypothetical protein [unclassified Sphingobium]